MRFVELRLRMETTGPLLHLARVWTMPHICPRTLGPVCRIVPSLTFAVQWFALIDEMSFFLRLT